MHSYKKFHLLLTYNYKVGLIKLNNALKKVHSCGKLLIYDFLLKNYRLLNS